LTDHEQDLTMMPREDAIRAIDEAVRNGIRAGQQQAAAEAVARSAEDRAIAVDVLSAEIGREAALEQLALKPETFGELAEKVTAEKQARAEAEAQRKAAEHALTPAGRREEAQAALQRRAAQETDVKLARALLAENPHYDDDLLGSMTYDELMTASGLAEPPAEEAPLVPPRSAGQAELDELDRQWWHLSEGQRREAVERLAPGANFEEIAAHKLEEANSDPRYNR
jgi:hypothetical protein